MARIGKKGLRRMSTDKLTEQFGLVHKTDAYHRRGKLPSRDLQIAHAMWHFMAQQPTGEVLKNQMAGLLGCSPDKLPRKFHRQLDMELNGWGEKGDGRRKRPRFLLDRLGRIVLAPGATMPKSRIDGAADSAAPLQHRSDVEPDENLAGEMKVDRKYVEGAVSQVLVNRYERDPNARSVCLEKLGHNCKVCGINFCKCYGEIGKGFIHVHHRKPMALRKAEYRLNPTKDPVPVCPNCHAMLHTSDPPLEVDELRGIWRKRGGP